MAPARRSRQKNGCSRRRGSWQSMTNKSSNPVAFMMWAAVVADPTRLHALFHLGDGPLTIGQLASAVGVTQAAASRHVQRMVEAGLVAAERLGRCTLVRRRERRWAVVESVIESSAWEDG
jgi:DNA-binding transcriptional ArsR family regulator